MKRLSISLAFLALSITLWAQSHEYDRDILYRGNGDEYLEKMCRLDVAYQKGTEDRPVIVWFHGGGLTGGARHIPEPLLKDGAVVVGVGYRFAPHMQVPQIIDDAAASVAWVLKNIERYGGSTSRIYLAGHSAGGYLVSMLALDKHYLQEYGIDPASFAGVIPYSGQAITHFAHRKMQGIPELQPIVDSLAPLYHVRPDTAPLLIISGDRELELYGRYEENAYFVRMLRLNGHKDVVFHEVDGFDHGNMSEPAHLLLLKYIRNRSRK